MAYIFFITRVINRKINISIFPIMVYDGYNALCLYLSWYRPWHLYTTIFWVMLSLFWSIKRQWKYVTWTNKTILWSLSSVQHLFRRYSFLGCPGYFRCMSNYVARMYTFGLCLHWCESHHHIDSPVLPYMTIMHCSFTNLWWKPCFATQVHLQFQRWEGN